MKTPNLMPDGKTPLVAAALEYATFAHAGQFRRDDVTPYIEHPKKVMALLEGYGDEAIAVAALHDSIEDGRTTALRLEDAGFPYYIVRAVVLLTKSEGQPYDAYLDVLSRNPIARMVKIADMLANLTDSPTPKQIERYTKGILFLSTTSH